MDLFEEQPAEYKAAVFPAGVPALRCSPEPRSGAQGGSARVHAGCGHLPPSHSHLPGAGVRLPPLAAFARATIARVCERMRALCCAFSVEAASPHGWERYAHAHIAMTTFGASGPWKDV